MQNRVLLAALAAFSAAAGVSAQTVIQLPDSLHAAGDTVEWVKKIPSFCEGPAWEAATGYVYFTRQLSSQANWPIIRIKPGQDTGVVWVANPRQANGLDFDPQGRLVAAQDGRITRYKADGSEDSVLVLSGANGVIFGQANDLAIGVKGEIYFTTNASSVYFLNAARQLSVAYSSATSANGVEWVEEDSALYVNESRQVKRYRVNANGSLSNPQTFITVLAGTGGTYADGGAIDAHGNRYIASFQSGELRVFNAKGDSIGKIVPRLVTGTSFDNFSGVMGNVSNAVFGGADMKTLYLTGDGGLFSIRLKVPGRARYPTGLRAPRAASLAIPKAAAALENRDVRGRALTSPTSIPAVD
jgi:gluconolactonase